MKRIALAMLGLVVLPAAALAQDQGWAANFFTNKGLTPNALTHNFGNVAFGAQLTHKFVITNVYNVPFKVTSATVSCGCVEVKKPDQVIPPRGTAELEALLNTRRIPVNQLNTQKTVTIFVTLTSVAQNPGDKIFTSACNLFVSGLARTNVVFNPDRINFGVVQAGQTPKLALDIEQAGTANWQITEVVAHKLPLDVELQPLKAVIPGRVSYRVNVALKKDAPAGEFKHEIQLKTNDRDTPILSLLAEGTVQAALMATPNSVDLGKVKTGTVVQRYIVLKGPGKPFSVTGFTGEGDGIKVRKPEKAATTHLVTIEFQPDKVGPVSKTLTIKTDLDGGLTATVTVVGEAIP